MGLQGEQFTIRQMMAAVAAAGIFLVVLKGFLFIHHGGLWSLLDRDSSSTRHLPPGQSVVIVQDCWAPDFQKVVPSSRQDFYNLDEDLAPRRYLRKGDIAVIELDQGDNDDTASRLVALKLVSGSIVAVLRGNVCRP